MKKIALLGMLIMCFAQTTYAILPVSQGNIQSAQMYGMGQKDVSTENLLAGWTIYDSKKQNRYGRNEHIIIYTPHLATAVDAQNTAKLGEKSTVQHGLELAREYDGILAVGAVLNTTFKAEPKLIKIQLTAGGKIYQPYYTSLEKATASVVNMPKAIVAGPVKQGGISAEEQAKLNQVQKEVDARNKAILKSELGKPPVAPNKAKAAVKKPAASNKPIVSNKPQTAATVPVKLWHLEYFTYFDLNGIAKTQPLTLSIIDQVGGERIFKINLNNLK